MPSDLIRRATAQELNTLRNSTYSDESSKAACRKLKLPISKPTIPAQNTNHPLEFSYTSNPFGFAITRRSNGEVLFNSTPGTSKDTIPSFNNLVFKDQYIELSTQLPPDSAIFGLGESTRSAGLRLAKGHTYTLWAAFIGSYNEDIDLYGSYPFYMDVRKQGLVHGVQLVNSNGMDCVYGDEALSFRIIGGVLDLYFFAGPSPRDVMDQYTHFVGRPAPMPYWTLGKITQPSRSNKIQIGEDDRA